MPSLAQTDWREYPVKGKKRKLFRHLMELMNMKYLLLIMLLMAAVSAGCIFVKNNNPPVTPAFNSPVPPTTRIVYVTVTTVSVTPSGTSDRAKELGAKIAATDSDLQLLRTHIDERAAQGFDISVAESKYHEALQKIDSARSRPSDQVTEALADLRAASVAINDGELSLN
jgi:hypothetical protein